MDLHERYVMKLKEFNYETGDKVWVRNLPHEGDKLDPLYTGPCEIVGRIGATGRYTVSMPHGHVDVHQERLKIYLPKIDGLSIPLIYFQPKRDIPQNDDFVVEQIVDHRLRYGQYQWLVKWRGYDSSENTWEPASSFLGAIQQDWFDYNRRHGIPMGLDNLVR